MAQEATSSAENIVLFDGVCNMCNGLVAFLLRHDKRERLLFCALQSEMGRSLLTNHQLPTDTLDTFVFIHRGRAYTRSSASMYVCKVLGGWWYIFFLIGIIVPTFLRDRIYAFIASKRYIWLGKQNTCMIPKPEWRHRFLGSK